MLLNFGQPLNGVVQMGFHVRNLDAAMEEFSARLGIGPWTVLRNFGGDAIYKGEPTAAKSHIALGFCGHMQYELIESADELPSLSRDTRLADAFGFHHFGVATSDFEASCRRYREQGYEEVFSAVPGGHSRVAYFDTRSILPGMVELMEVTPQMEDMFTSMYRDAIGWNGNASGS